MTITIAVVVCNSDDLVGVYVHTVGSLIANQFKEAWELRYSSDLAAREDPGQVSRGGHVAVHPGRDGLRDGGEGGVRSEMRRKHHHTPHQLQPHNHKWRD